MKALVTRPREDAAALAASLAARGIEPVLEPLLEIRFAADGARRLAPALDGAQAVLFTSANGVRAFAAACARRDLAAFAVGDATAAAARGCGMARVESAGGEVADLAQLVCRRLDPAAGTLLHAAASVVAGDLQGALATAGFTVRRIALYEAVPAARLSPESAASLAQGRIALALFFSPRTAASFVRLAAEAGVADACRAVTAIALSAAVGAALERIAWRAIAIADAATEAALVAAVERAVADGTVTVGGGQDASP